MADIEDPNLFNLLGENVKLRESKDAHGEAPDKDSVTADVFVDEEMQDPDEQIHPLLFKWLSVVIAVIALVGLGALAYGLWGTQPEHAPQMLIPVTDRELSPEEKDIERSRKTVQELSSLVANYLAASTIEDRLKYVRQPQRVRALMVDWYEVQRRPLEIKEADPLMTLVPKTIFGKSFWKAEIADPKLGKKQLWIQEYQDGSYKIDWETDVFYNPMRWDIFLADKPLKPVSFRVYIGWNDLYLYQHRDESEFQSFRIENKDSDLVATAYMPHEDLGCKQLMYYIKKNAPNSNRLKSGVTLPFLVTLKFDESPEGKKNLVIEKLVSPSWIIFEEAEDSSANAAE